MSDLDTFTQSYAETALWSSTSCDEDGNNCEPLDDNYGVEDIAPATLAQMIEDCRDFREAAGALLDDIDDSQAGHDFWLTRNRHGAGFWDRGLGEVGDKLTDIAHSYGSVDLYVGDDGLIYS